jgi:hypothetical protein
MEVETKSIAPAVAMHSLIGTGPERPCGWGNYFSLHDKGRAVRVLNMWMENLEDATNKFLDDGLVKIRLYRDGERAWCLIDDPRIPADYYYNKLCFTGAPHPPFEVVCDAYAHLGDPHNELEQFTDPASYYAKRGGRYNAESGSVSYTIK